LISTPSYFRSPPANIWRFDATFQALEWADGVESEHTGRTIALSAEVALCLRSLARQLGGLPDFTAVLFLLAASRETSDARFLSGVLGRCHHSASTARFRPRFHRLFRDLRDVRSQGRSDFGDVLVVLFGKHLGEHLVADRVESDDAIRWLETPLAERATTEIVDPPTWLPADDDVASPSIPQAGWDLLVRIASQPIDAGKLMRQIRTGVADPPPPAAIEPIRDEQFSGLIEQLKSDACFGEIATAARHIASVMTLPLRPSDPASLPTGGVSDVSNRGNPEQLLATELAADPDLLLVRIASGQALYLRRESPPETGKRARTILIENSVRTWGQTRIRGLAVALGLAASEQSRHGSALSIATLAGDRHHEEDFSGTTGLTAHLERLSPTRHPGAALWAWANDPGAGGATGDGKSKQHPELPVLVLAAQTWTDPEFRRLAMETRLEFLVVAIAASGDVQLSRWDRAGEARLRRLTLDTLRLGERRPRVALKSAAHLPTFLRLPECPLRQGINSSPNWCAASGVSGLWIRTPDQRLLWYDREGKGGHVVLQRMSFHDVLAHRTRGALLELVLTLRDRLHYVCIDADEGLHSNRTLDASARGECFFDLDSLYIRDGSQLHLIDKSSGKQLDVVQTSGREIAGVPFHFATDGSAMIPHREDDRIRFYRFPHAARSIRLAYGFRDENDAPLLVDDFLTQIWHLDPSRSPITISGQFQEHYRLVHLVGRSSDGKKAVFDATPSRRGNLLQRKICLDLTTGQATQSSVSSGGISDLVRLGEPAIRFFRQLASLSRLVGAGIDRDGLILFPRTRRVPKRLVLDAEGRFGLIETREVDTVPVRRFEHTQYVELDPATVVATPGRCHTGWGVRRIAFGDAALWLDSRGMLHLDLRDDPGQLTLTLGDEFAGWFSATGVFGNPYFHDGRSNDPPPEDARKWYRAWLAAARRGVP